MTRREERVDQAPVLRAHGPDEGAGTEGIVPALVVDERKPSAHVLLRRPASIGAGRRLLPRPLQLGASARILAHDADARSVAVTDDPFDLRCHLRNPGEHKVLPDIHLG